MDMPSATGAFGKLKSFFIKVIPVIGVVIGFFIAPFIMQPIATWMHGMIGDIEPAGQITASGHLTEYLWWIPAGLVVGGGLGIGGYFMKSLSEMAGNFLIGMGVGAFLFALYAPFAENIWKWF